MGNGLDHIIPTEGFRICLDEAARAWCYITGGKRFGITGVAVTEVATEVVDGTTLFMTLIKNRVRSMVLRNRLTFSL